MSELENDIAFVRRERDSWRALAESSNKRADELAAQLDAAKAPQREPAREPLSMLEPPVQATSTHETYVIRLEQTIRDSIEALERNSTSAPVVECLKAALSAAQSDDRAPETSEAGSNALSHDTIEGTYTEWCKTLTVMDQPDAASFGQGYVLGWNAKEAASRRQPVPGDQGILHAYLNLAARQSSPGATTDADLVARCQELLDWNTTSLLHGGKGGKVRELADRLQKTKDIPEDQALKLAEINTRDDALREVVRLAAANVISPK
jgi:hypothetical protein